MTVRTSFRLREAEPCFACGKPTLWVDLSFECPLCPGECTESTWAGFEQALSVLQDDARRDASEAQKASPIDYT